MFTFEKSGTLHTQAYTCEVILIYRFHQHEEVTRHLDRLDTIRKVSDQEARTPLLQVKASFEFTYRTDFVALHVKKTP